MSVRIARIPRRSALVPAALAVALALAACAGDGYGDGPQGPPDPPRVTGFDPVEARIGEEVRILGRNFGGDPAGFEVRFGQVVATVTAVGETSATFVVPEVLPGQTPVVVSVDGRDSDPAVFTVLGPAFVPNDGNASGRWQRTLLRTAADGACPDPLAEHQIVELRIEDFELTLGEATGDVELDGTWTATGTVVLDDGSSIEISIDARFTIQAGHLAIVGTLVRDHRAPNGTTTCTETYDLLLEPA